MKIWEILNKQTGKVDFSPIYDCGSCLNPMLKDYELKDLSKTELKELSINCYSDLKENGKKINYMTYLKKMSNEECNKAVVRCFNNIRKGEVEKFIDNIECMSETRKISTNKLLI